ncbi:phenylalanine--tRNA ligase subunit alpha [Mycoplasma sp. Ms02]|uniref:phenylalanine--tRNA ligase subunit alpha n=1 Tax=Mycoplasma sp. Ms02 TaxID=353851 RepID=UPI001C8A15A2|nr:phenylalanine--tRNA ligase subunit alpha [Mycoplasma sp. Ms02]QZE12381.1 phenylalanine--tRNA ligase subunit alpha [Mycoplasma sp. Ms02]
MLDLNKINNLEDLKNIKNKLLSEGSELNELTNKLKSAQPHEKKEIGKQVSDLKKQYEEFFKKAQERIEMLEIERKMNAEILDVTKPNHFVSSLHLITQIENRMREWFVQNGYYEQTAGEIVSDLFNFERLNIPEDHPARAMHDSLYLNAKTLLRTHNTGISAVELEKNKNQAFATFAIGKVYRNDEDDATHSHQFTQVDFVNVGRVSFPNLIWTLKSLLSYVLEQEVEVRLRPSYFPFTEPSVEVDMFYNNRWIEVLGAGMLHPNVMKMAGFTDKNLNAFAAGIGIERITMIKYGVKDIRDFYRNDLRVLGQFKYEK